MLGPIYIAEVSPAQWRGRLVALFQFTIVLGILVAYISNYGVSLLHLGALEWRVKLAVGALPAVLFVLMLCSGIPRSPRWLVKKAEIAEAQAVLAQIGAAERAEAAVGADRIGNCTWSPHLRWLNQVKRFFAPITTRAIRRGSFCSVPHLQEAILADVDQHNRDPKPFRRITVADSFLGKVAAIGNELRCHHTCDVSAMSLAHLSRGFVIGVVLLLCVPRFLASGQATAATSITRVGNTKPLPKLSLLKHPLNIGLAVLLLAGMAMAQENKSSCGAGERLPIAVGQTRVAFDRATGSIVSVVHARSGREFITPEKIMPLFRVMLTRPAEGKSNEVLATAFKKITAEPSGDSQIVFRFQEHPTLPLEAAVTVKRGDDGLLHFRLALRNRSDWAVASVCFPQIACPATLGSDMADDQLIYPGGFCNGVVFPAPGSRTRSLGPWGNSYPGLLFAQFTALYDHTAGLYLAVYDANGHCKKLRVDTEKNRWVQLCWEHLVPEEPGKDVGLPYDVVLATFTGDWRDAADIYKSWAKQQPWCRTRLTQRKDVPLFLKEGTGFLCPSHSIPDDHALAEQELEKVPALLAAYHERTDLPHIAFITEGWENRGGWAGIHYFPARPSNEAWRRVATALRQQGDYVYFMISGYWWVVKRQANHHGPAFDDSGDLPGYEDQLIKKPDGSIQFNDQYHDQSTYVGLSASLCHGSEAAKQTMERIFLDAARIGGTMLSFDQELGGGQGAPCYSKTHRHPPGFGNWMWTDFRDLCERILTKGRAINPDLNLSMEACSELAIPYMGFFETREHGGVACDPWEFEGRGVGLFSYLYHEYAIGIDAGSSFGQGQAHIGRRGPAELRCFVRANILVRGVMPGEEIADVPLNPANAWERAVSATYFSFCKPYRHFAEYLILGETRRPPEICCATQELYFWHGDENGEPIPNARPKGPKKGIKVPVTLPTVIAGSFEAEDGSVGTVIVNTTAQAQQAAVRLAPARGVATLYRADRTEVQRWDKVPPEISLTLEPFGVRMLVVCGAAK